MSINRSTIYITNLSLRTIVGNNDWEREKKQDVVINISIDFHSGPSIESDDISQTVDYKTIKHRVIDVVEKSSFRLLEALTNAIVQTICDTPGVVGTRVRVDKPHALRFCDSVAVEMAAGSCS